MKTLDAFWEAGEVLWAEGDFEGLRTLATAFEAAFPDAPEPALLRGVALHGLDELEAAAVALERATTLAPDWADAWLALARLAFRRTDFDVAARILAEQEEVLASLPDAHVLSGLLHERAGREPERRQAFAAARALDPESATWPEVSASAFRKKAERAFSELPDLFRSRLRNVALIVDAVPTDDLLKDAMPPHDPEILGLFVGIPQSEAPSGDMPNHIYLFQRNIERMATTPEELDEEIRTTLYHEIAHALGFEEEEMADLGLE